MANDGIEVPIDGNPTGFRRAMQEVMQSSKDAAKGIESSFAPLQKVFEGVQGKIAAIGIALGGLAVLRGAVDTTAKFTEESIKLGRALGISATEASLLKEALDANETSQEEFVAGAQKLAKQVKENESGLNAMGLKTRDAAGHLLPLKDLMFDAIQVLNGYKAGTDRAIAAQVLFGKGFELTSNLAKMNKKTAEELIEVQRELGAIVGEENVTAWNAFDDAGDKAHLTLKAMKIAIGNALLPVLTDMSNWFTSIGPAAVTVIKGAFGGLVATFHLVTTGVTVLWETINAMVVTVAEPIRALAVAISKALSGDWAGAASEIKNIGTVISGAWGQAFDEMAAKAQKTRDQIWNLFAQPSDAAKAKDGDKDAPNNGNKNKPKKGEKDPESYMQYYEGALEEEKRLAYERDALRGYSKQEELAFWQMLIANADLKGKDRLAIERKISGLIVEIKRTEAKQRMELDGEGIRSGESLALGRVEAERAAAQISLDLGTMSKAQFLALEENFEQQRFEIQRTALEERMKLLEKDPNTNPVEFARIKNQILELEQQHELKRIQLRGQALQEDMQVWGNLSNRMGGLWNKGMQAMLNGTLTWRNSIKAIGAEMVAWFAIDVVGAQVKTWIAGEAMKLAKKMGFFAAEKAMTLAEIPSLSGLAGAGGVASMAAAPFPINMSAPAFGAAMAAAAMAYAPLASAAGGYDIPAGINPLTQLHAKEMVLPETYADVIRGLAGNGGSAGGSFNVTVHAVDAAGVRRLFMDNGGALADALKAQVRNFKR